MLAHLGENVVSEKEYRSAMAAGLPIESRKGCMRCQEDARDGLEQTMKVRIKQRRCMSSAY